MIGRLAKTIAFLASPTGLTLCAVVVLAILFTGLKCTSDRAERAETDRRVAEGQADAGRGAAEITADQTEAEADSRVLDAQNRKDIMETDNADQDAGDAGRAGLRALCSRMPDNPRCRD